MDFTEQNNLERNYYQQDFSPVAELLKRIRKSLITGNDVRIGDLNFQNIFDYQKQLSFTSISVFYPHLPKMSWGSTRSTLEDTINRNLSQIRTNLNFNKFDFADTKNCRILIEMTYQKFPVRIEEINIYKFDDYRFEPGLTGFELTYKGKSYYYQPTETYVQSIMSLKQALNALIRKTDIKKETKYMSERIEILRKTDYELFLTKSRAFVSYNDGVVPLYHGTTFNDYSPEVIKDVSLKAIDWIMKYQQDNGKFMYYYDAKCDNYVDHEHPNAPEDNLYYNDLRHCGGIISLIRAYQLTKDKKYLQSAKKGLDYITSITKYEEDSAYVFLNRKAKLGGTGLALAAMMRYRIETAETIFDEYIVKYVRHLIKRVHETGEFMGYYIHPNFQNGNPLIDMSAEERKATFSFYYPGEALLGLALFFNYFTGEDELKAIVKEKSMLALDWLILERPKLYADMFTALPSDAWLMQAIEEWSKNNEFLKDDYINFVFTDANTLVEKMYKKDDSPFIDYEGGYYYNYGDHFYPDGARSEGLVAACLLANRLNRPEYDKLLQACRLAAKSQLILVNDERNVYPHQNPEKSNCGIRFKATRQWIRVDSIQHVVCFYLRLYFQETGINPD